VRKVYLPLSFVCLLFSFLLLPVVKAGKVSSTGRFIPEHVPSEATSETDISAVEYATNILYDSLNLGQLGLSKEALLYAYKGQKNLARKGKLNNADILTVCDFTQPSENKRMYIIDVSNFKVLLNTYVAHGKNSGLNYAEKFSNNPRSLKSSLGFYITKNVYFGKHGLSLKLSGEDRGFNDNAEERAVVVHGAKYIGCPGGVAAGRSFGCPAVPQKVASKVINLIKGGSCLFIYHPSRTYLYGSKVLNG
jgi:hypothetical protein